MLNQYGKSGLKGLSKKLLVAAGVVTALGAMSGRANAATFPPFTFNPNVLSGVSGYGTAIGGDDLNGPYEELLTITGANTFSVVAYAQLYTINGTNNVPLGSGVSGDNTGTANGYYLYATFTSSGTFVNNGTTVVFTGTSGSATVANDPLGNVGPCTVVATTTTCGGDSYNTATGVITPGGSADQVLAQNVPLVPGISAGTGSANLDTGSFNFTFAPLTLTALGSTFFTSPVPFYAAANVTGQFQNFSLST